MLLIPIIKSKSNSVNYQKEWTLIVVFKARANSKIKCICDTLTKNYRVYYNFSNGHFLRIGLDCYTNHSESFTQIGLTEVITESTVAKSFVSELFNATAELINYQNINELLKTSKRSHALMQQATNYAIEQALNKPNKTEALNELIHFLGTLSDLLLIIEYKTSLRETIERLHSKIVLERIESLEIDARSKILKESEHAFNEISSSFNQSLKIERLYQCNRYLSSLPLMISENLKLTYPLPDALWQLEQTNGYKNWRST